MIESASLSAFAGMVRPIATATRRLPPPSSRNTPAVVRPPACRQRRDPTAGAGHKARIEHIDARHHAGTAVSAGPGLHGGKDRDNEQATGDREQAQIEPEVNAPP